jgi:cytochrome b561
LLAAQWNDRTGDLNVFGWFATSSPFTASRALHEAAENAHAGITLPFHLVLLIVHILAVLKNLVIN